MKNFVTRTLALVIALSVLLLPMSAFAAERNAFSLTVGNIEMSMDDETLTIPVAIQIGGGADLSDPNVRGYFIANLLSGEESALSALASVENGEVRAYLNGMDYGIVIPLEQLMALAEPVLAELEGELTNAMSDLTGQVSPELEAAVTRTVEAYMALLEEAATNPEAYGKAQLDALGITLTEGTEADTIRLFDVEVSAIPTAVNMEEKTMAEIFDAQMNATPAAAEFYNAYFDLINEFMVMMGEEKVDFKTELAKIEGTMSLYGGIYTAENGMQAELVMPITIDGETVEFPMTITSLTDDEGTYNDFLMGMEIDGETFYINVYADDFTDEDGSFANIVFAMGYGDAEAEAYATEVEINLYSAYYDGMSEYGITMTAADGTDVYDLSLGYVGYPVKSSDAADSYDGFLFLTAEDSTMAATVYVNTNLTLTSVPEGELLTLANSINPLEADDAALEKLGNDAMTAVMQGLGTLLQNPAIAALMGE